MPYGYKKLSPAYAGLSLFTFLFSFRRNYPDQVMRVYFSEFSFVISPAQVRDIFYTEKIVPFLFHTRYFIIP